MIELSSLLILLFSALLVLALFLGGYAGYKIKELGSTVQCQINGEKLDFRFDTITTKLDRVLVASQSDNRKLNDYISNIDAHFMRLIASVNQKKEDNRQPPHRELSIETLPLDTRSSTVLANLQIRTLGDLENITENEILTTPNYGRTSLNKLKFLLRDYSISIGSNRGDF